MITTVCMNPCFDKTATVDVLQAGQLNRIEGVRYDVGGKGVNVAAVLRHLDVEAACVGCLGEEDAPAFMQMIEKMRVPFTYLPLRGKVRTNFKLLELKSKTVSEFNESGPSMTPDELEAFIALLMEQANQSDYVVFSGRTPVGCADDTYQRCMRALPAKRCVLDASGDALTLGLSATPYLIKPNLPELEQVMGAQLRTLRSIRDAALTLLKRGAQNAVVSMGKYGALCTDGRKTVYAPALSLEPRSTVGAGDAMIAGMLLSLGQGGDLFEAFRAGMAAGTASVLTDGTQPFDIADYERFLGCVTPQEV